LVGLWGKAKIDSHNSEILKHTVNKLDYVDLIMIESTPAVPNSKAFDKMQSSRRIGGISASFSYFLYFFLGLASRSVDFYDKINISSDAFSYGSFICGTQSKTS
jgi:hypothetical protein